MIYTQVAIDVSIKGVNLNISVRSVSLLTQESTLWCSNQMEHHPHKDRAEWQRISEIEGYFGQQKAVEITILALDFIIGLYIERVLAGLLITLSLFKLLMLLVYSVVERQSCSLLATRSQQFWLYRFILFLQMFILVVVLIEMMSAPVK